MIHPSQCDVNEVLKCNHLFILFTTSKLFSSPVIIATMLVYNQVLDHLDPVLLPIFISGTTLHHTALMRRTFLSVYFLYSLLPLSLGVTSQIKRKITLSIVSISSLRGMRN